MDKKTLQRLEYHRVLEQLAAHAGTPLGRELALALEPSSDYDTIKRWLDETSEGRELLRLDPTAELGGWFDVRSAVARAARGGVLEAEELFYIGRTVAAVRRIRAFFSERQERYPLLAGLALRLGSFSALEKEIENAILPGGEVADRASETLAQLRRKISRAQVQIKEQLERLIRSPQMQKYLQDPIVTIREGRYVVPVKTEHREQVPGIVHDQSASGATLFVEPMAVVEANNELRRLQLAEKQEILRILTELSRRVAGWAPELEATLAILGRLDFIMARARYSYRLNAWAPELLPRPLVDLRQARHPLLKGEVVPVTIHVGRDFDTLIITGPNTGGKTVALKTVGLLVLMTQSGLHIPAAEGSRVGIFAQVFADIGDEQSIEQSLSTFSSHMQNIVAIIRKAGPASLVLLDELGAGTDPVEGAALARAILEHLQAAGAKTVATTHYAELKHYALQAPRVENASVEFDTATLTPTYRLLIGRPGRSNAFIIARRLGLPEIIVQRARELLTAEQVQLEDLLAQLEKTQREAEEELRAARTMRTEAAAALMEARRQKEEIDTRREELLARAREEARRLVKEAQREAERIIKELREQLKAEETRQRERAVQRARESLQQLSGHLYEEEMRARRAGGEDEGPPAELTPGQEVFVPLFGQNGTVLAVDGDEVQVQVGAVRFTLPREQLRAADSTGVRAGSADGSFANAGMRRAGAVGSDPEGTVRTKTAALAGGGRRGDGLGEDVTAVAGPRGGAMELGRLKAQLIETRLDLRGLYADEALLQLEKYLDDVRLAGLERVVIVHGKGTGALRAAVHQYLKKHPYVKSFRLADQSEGGSGATVVEMK